MWSFSRLPYISKCCCFIELRISAYLIGFLQMLFGLAFLIYAITNTLTKKQINDHHEDNSERHTNELYIFGSGYILLGLILVVGVKIKNVLFVKVYIVLEIIGLIIGFVIYIIALINLFLAFVIATEETFNFAGHLIEKFAIATAEILIVVIVVAFAIIAWKAYLLLCVNSYLRELIKLESGTPQAVGYTAVAESDEHNLKV